MTNININIKNRTIVVSKAFATKASRFGSEEYTLLKQAPSENPNYRVEIKSTRTNKRNSLKGLNYEFMEDYILTHNKDLHKEFLDRVGRSENEFGLKTKGATYMENKKWFLESFPEIAAFENNAKNYKVA